MQLGTEIISTRSSAIAERPHDALCQFTSHQLLYSTAIQKITFEKVCTQGHRNCWYLMGHTSLP